MGKCKLGLLRLELAFGVFAITWAVNLASSWFGERWHIPSWTPILSRFFDFGALIAFYTLQASYKTMRIGLFFVIHNDKSQSDYHEPFYRRFNVKNSQKTVIKGIFWPFFGLKYCRECHKIKAWIWFKKSAKIMILEPAFGIKKTKISLKMAQNGHFFWLFATLGPKKSFLQKV